VGRIHLVHVKLVLQNKLLFPMLVFLLLTHVSAAGCGSLQGATNVINVYKINR